MVQCNAHLIKLSSISAYLLVTDTWAGLSVKCPKLLKHHMYVYQLSVGNSLGRFKQSVYAWLAQALKFF